MATARALVMEPSLLIEAMRAFPGLRSKTGAGTSAAYLDWRLHTAYGTAKTRMQTDDLVHYLRWRRQMRGIRRWEQAI